MIKHINQFIKTDNPILIVGWSEIKKLYPNQKITNKQINHNLWWTFSEKEKKVDYDKDIVKFYDLCINEFDSKFTYWFLNPFELYFSDIRRLIFKINNSRNKLLVYENDKHLFLLIDDIVIGLNMDFFNLTTISLDSIKCWLNSKNFEFIENFELFNIKNNIINKDYLIPCLVSQQNEDDKQCIIGYVYQQ